MFFKSLIVCAFFGLGSCTNYQYIDTGVAEGIHDCTVWEYLHTQSSDWDSTVLLIERAGMKAYFDGSMKDAQITFFGVTNLSILRLMLDHNQYVERGEIEDEPWNKVLDIPEETCRYILSRLIVQQRLMVSDVPKGNLQRDGWDYKEINGKVYPTLEGELFAYTYQEAYNKIPEKGEIGLYIRLHDSDNNLANRIVSTNIQMTNGIVHALSYNFDLMSL